MDLLPDDRLAVVGDSVVAAGRDPSRPVDLGHGWVALVAQHLWATRAVEVANLGRDGDTAALVRARWAAEVLGWRPTVVVLAVGINDTWRTRTGQRARHAAFEADLRAVLEQAHAHEVRELVVVEPFVVPVAAEQDGWAPDLAARVAIARGVADDVGATWVPTSAAMARAAAAHGSRAVATDGVHPTALGHRVLADAWLDAVGR